MKELKKKEKRGSILRVVDLLEGKWQKGSFSIVERKRFRKGRKIKKNN